MADYDKTNTGVLFRNDRKTNDRQPDHTGTLNVEGVEYWVSAWIKEGKRGRFFSIALTKKEDAGAKQQARNFSDFDKDEEPPF